MIVWQLKRFQKKYCPLDTRATSHEFWYSTRSSNFTAKLNAGSCLSNLCYELLTSFHVWRLEIRRFFYLRSSSDLPVKLCCSCSASCRQVYKFKYCTHSGSTGTCQNLVLESLASSAIRYDTYLPWTMCHFSYSNIKFVSWNFVKT
jgi:hypothetical protein